MEKYSSGKCTICNNFFTMLVWHHTIPQALGGVDSLQIPLCADCHTVLHANADAIVAKIQSGKNIKRIFWRNDEIAHRAQPYVKLIVDAVLHHDIDEMGKDYKLNVVVNKDIHRALNLLKADLKSEGITNLHDTVLYCIVDMLSNRGLYNGTNHNQKHSKESTQNSNSSRSDLW